MKENKIKIKIEKLISYLHSSNFIIKGMDLVSLLPNVIWELDYCVCIIVLIWYFFLQKSHWSNAQILASPTYFTLYFIPNKIKQSRAMGLKKEITGKYKMKLKKRKSSRQCVCVRGRGQNLMSEISKCIMLVLNCFKVNNIHT